MADPTYGPKTYRSTGGDKVVIASGGELKMETGSTLTANGTQAAATTAALTQLTPADAAGTPDYAIAAITNSTPFGFSNAAEAITVLYVIQNLQIQVAELKAAMVGVKIIPS